MWRAVDISMAIWTEDPAAWTVASACLCRRAAPVVLPFR